MKIIITHLNPDLDAITSVWLLKRFAGGEFEEAEVKFIPAGTTYKNQPVDKNENVVHVDTGFGRFDHHGTGRKTCAARLVLKYLALKSAKVKKDQALKRLIRVVEAIDFKAEDLYYPDPGDDRYAFLFNERQIINGWQKIWRNDSGKHLEYGLLVLDGIYANLKEKIRAEEIIKESVLKFKTGWGQAVAAETDCFAFTFLAQMKRFALVINKDPKRGHVRIHGLPKKGIDLTGLAKVLEKADPAATWFLHASKRLLLNGSTANPEMKPTKLSLKEIVEVIKKI